MFIPDSYSPLSYDADIAIIILAFPVEFNFYVRPACIPESYNSLIEEYQVQEGNKGTVSKLLQQGRQEHEILINMIH